MSLLMLACGRWHQEMVKAAGLAARRPLAKSRMWGPGVRTPHTQTNHLTQRVVRYLTPLRVNP